MLPSCLSADLLTWPSVHGGLRMHAPALSALMIHQLAPSLPSAATEAGSWVRPKAGIYKHDLAKVIEADPSNQVSRGRPSVCHVVAWAPAQCATTPAALPPQTNPATPPRPTVTRVQRATIKLVPRIDLAALAARKPEDARANFGKQPKVKPPAKPFNPDEVGRGGQGSLNSGAVRMTLRWRWCSCAARHSRNANRHVMQISRARPAGQGAQAAAIRLFQQTCFPSALCAPAGQGAPAGSAPAAGPGHGRCVLHPQRQPALPGGVRHSGGPVGMEAGQLPAWHGGRCPALCQQRPWCLTSPVALLPCAPHSLHCSPIHPSHPLALLPLPPSPRSYLVRSVAMKSLILQETLPPLDELQKFNAAAQVGRWWAGT